MIGKKNSNFKIIMALIFLVILGLACVILPVFLNLKIELLVCCFLGYILFITILWACFGKVKNKLIKKMIEVLCFPLFVFYILLQLILPTLTLMFSATILLIITFGLPFILFNSIEYIFAFGLTKSTMGFLSITLGTIISVYCSKYLLPLILRISPQLNSEKMGTKYLRELVTLFYQKNNVIFFIYLCYFVFLLIMSFMKIQYTQPLFSKNTDLAILQSFLVFIAFTNMIMKSKDVLLAPKSLLIIYLKIIFSGIEDNKDITI